MNKILAKIFALTNAFSPIEISDGRIRIGYTWLSTVYCKYYNTVFIDLFGILQYVKEVEFLAEESKFVSYRAVMIFGTLGIGIDATGKKTFRIYKPYVKPGNICVKDEWNDGYKLNDGIEVSVWSWLGHLVLSPILWLQYIMFNLFYCSIAKALLPLSYDPHRGLFMLGSGLLGTYFYTAPQTAELSLAKIITIYVEWTGGLEINVIFLGSFQCTWQQGKWLEWETIDDVIINHLTRSEVLRYILMTPITYIKALWEIPAECLTEQYEASTKILKDQLWQVECDYKYFTSKDDQPMPGF